MRIIVDAMGGDNAPLELLRGAIQATAEIDDEIILVGNKDEILKVARENDLSTKGINIYHTTDAITMEDDPIKAVLKKRNSSLSVGLRLLKENYADALVSAGNTGALFAGATLFVRKIKKTSRCAIGVVLPAKEPCLLIDGGANVTVNSEQLEQFALMGTVYMRKVYGMAEPKVGLLNNGVESCKGTPLHIEANLRLSQNSNINYIGNVEAGSVLFGGCNVLVADGFSGNILLKALEGMGKMIIEYAESNFLNDCSSGADTDAFKVKLAKMKRLLDSSEYGGSPIIGISKPVIKAHGGSNAKAIKNAILSAKKYAEGGVIEEISSTEII